jgi:hypothetical protein
MRSEQRAREDARPTPLLREERDTCKRTRHPVLLSRGEVEFFLELLESECANLPPEIRRTGTPTFQEKLRRRLEQVDRLTGLIRSFLTPIEPRAGTARAKLTRMLRRRPRADKKARGLCRIRREAAGRAQGARPASGPLFPLRRIARKHDAERSLHDD